MENNLPNWVLELKPYIRAKIFEIPKDDGVNLHTDLSIENLHIKTQVHLESLSARVAVCQTSKIPYWANIENYTSSPWTQIIHDLLIIFWDEERRLLFVNSTIDNDLFFDRIAKSIVSSALPHPVPLYKIQRVYAGAQNTHFVNVGMRNRTLGNQNEVYRLLTGSEANLAITRTDARTHVKGHVFGKGIFDIDITSLGFTDSGKIWSSNKSDGIVEILKQFRFLAGKIVSQELVITNSELDGLSAGEALTEIPSDIIAASWHEEIYRYEYSLHGQPLVDWEIHIDRSRHTSSSVGLSIANAESAFEVDYYLKSPHFKSREHTPIVLDNKWTLEEFLNQYPIKLYTSDQSLIIGDQIFRLDEKIPPFDSDKVEVVGWTNVNIKNECNSEQASTGKTIHQFVQDSLKNRLNTIIFYDHGSGEIADYIAIMRKESFIKVWIYHIKASKAESPGSRVDDLYEVCGQAIKSVIWLKAHILFNRLQARLKDSQDRLVFGDLGKLIEEYYSNHLPVEFGIVIVQPGISKSRLNTKLLELLASTEDYVRRVGEATLLVWASQ